MTDDFDGDPDGLPSDLPAGGPPERRTTLPTTSQRLAQLGRDLEDLALPAGAAGVSAGLLAAKLLGRCWPAVLSVATVETVLVDEGLRDAPGSVVRRHRRATRGRQAELLQALVDALGADQVDQRRGAALLLADNTYGTSTDEAGMHLGWWLGDDGPSLQAAIELKNQVRGPLRAIVTDLAAADAVRRAGALAEIALHLTKA